jgi:16S rRNA (adenine1518-N6/adenine1519-N6)-dimethyltransferase
MRDPEARIRRATQRRWGQNFLVNRRAADRILAAFAPDPADRVLEIGPGDGALTRDLAGRVVRLVAVEVDPSLAGALARRLGEHLEAGRLSIVTGDVLEIDLPGILRDLAAGRAGGARVLANLPYNIATAVVLRLLECGAHLRDLMVMVQREVAERIVSPPRRKSYGALSVLCQTRARVETILRLGPGSFRPVPKVDSAVIRFTLIPSPEAHDPTALSALLRAAFHQRRKTLLNNLAGFRPPGPDQGTIGTEQAAAWLQRAGIDPRTRAEQIPPQGFLDLLGWRDRIRSR